MFSTAIKGIWHYRRISVVMIAAVAIATTVVGGAFVVGDSIRYSLRRMTEQRLGNVTDVLTAPLFFRQDFVESLSERVSDPASLAPALTLQGALEHQETDDLTRRAGSVSVFGISENGWKFLDHGDLRAPVERGIVLGFRTAQELAAEPGDELSLWLELPSSIPRDSLLGERDEVSVEIVLTVQSVIPEDVGATRFSLYPGQQLPFNAFVSLPILQERLGIEELVVSRRNPVARAARVNSVLVATDTPAAGDGEAFAFSDALNESVNRCLTPDDLGLKFRAVTDKGYISAETDRMILDNATADAVMAAADQLGLVSTPSIVYLSNEIFAADRESTDVRYSMYSIIAGIDLAAPAPFSPVTLTSGESPAPLSDDEILLSRWLADDLDVEVGDEVGTLWHAVGSHGELPEIRSTFKVAGILAPNDTITVDQHLTPQVAGVTDVEDFGDVDQPFEMDMDRLTERDDDYWKEHRATPKAFVSLTTAKELWESRYGTFTSIRLAPSDGGADSSGEQLQSIVDRLAFEVPRRIDAQRLGFTFRPIRQEGLAAAVGANDFSQLFFGFSFFLIVSAIMLAALMFRLGLQQRIRQFGLLNAVGWPQGLVRRLFGFEGLLLAAVGVVIGAAAAVGFAHLMIKALTTFWIGAVGTTSLAIDVQPLKLIIAAAIIEFVAYFVLSRSVRSFQQHEIREQLSGNLGSQEFRATAGWRRLVPGLCLTFAVALPVLVIQGLVPSQEAFAGITWPMVCFFVAGFACLTGGLTLFANRLRRRSSADMVGSDRMTISSLAVANAARNPSRSSMSTALIAFATFVIVAVGAGRRNPLTETPDRQSGNGGFRLLAESAQPILFDLNSKSGRDRLGISDDAWPTSAKIFSFSVRPGEDASCVNLYQTRVPTILGASQDFLARGGFRFADTPGENPWTQLSEPIAPTDGIPVIPVIGDNNTLTYSLKKSIEDRIAVPNDETPEFYLKIVGKLDGSVFQGVLITSDDHLKEMENDISGARYFLAECDTADDAKVLSGTLESQLSSYGLDAESVNDRIAAFLSVQNTYLSTFQLLGGLGLLVGTFGLGVVMLRNVMERGPELALLQALGFRKSRIARLVLRENMLLLVWGVLLGTGAALLAMMPHLRSTGGQLPWLSLTVTLVIVLASGVVACLVAIRAAFKASIRLNLSST